MHLVRNYEIDGLHLDRIRYPDITIAGQTPSTGTSVGYNPTSIARFQRRYGIPSDSPPPAQNDPRWNQWRRDQVTNLVRRDLPRRRGDSSPPQALGLVHRVRVRARYRERLALGRSVLARLSGLASVDRGRHHRRRHADDLPARSRWRPGRTAFDRWNEWVRNHQYARSAAMGIGSFLNGVEGTLTQVRRALEPSALGHPQHRRDFLLDGDEQRGGPGQPAVRSARAEHAGEAVCRFRVGPGHRPNQRRRDAPGGSGGQSRADLRPACGDSGSSLEDRSAGRPPSRALFATSRVQSWTPATSLSSRVAGEAPPAARRTSAAGATDGNGYYGAVDLAPGLFRVTVTPVGQTAYASPCDASISAGRVTTFDITIDRSAPRGKLTADPAVIWPPNQKMITVTLSGAMTDSGTGLRGATFRVLDEYGAVQPSIDPVDGDGQTLVEFSRTVELEASRRGGDHDGRTVHDRGTPDGSCMQHHHPSHHGRRPARSPAVRRYDGHSGPVRAQVLRSRNRGLSKGVLAHSSCCALFAL